MCLFYVITAGTWVLFKLFVAVCISMEMFLMQYFCFRSNLLGRILHFSETSFHFKWIIEHSLFIQNEVFRWAQINFCPTKSVLQTKTRKRKRLFDESGWKLYSNANVWCVNKMFLCRHYGYRLKSSCEIAIWLIYFAKA